MRVSASAHPQSTAAAIANRLMEKREAILRAIGAGAVNQAIKAIAIARGIVATRGFDLVCRPGWENIEGKDGAEISAVVIFVTI